MCNGSIIGPFLQNPFGNEARFSPLDTRPKKGTTELRIILNLSYPFKSGSVNASIDGELYMGTQMNLTYPTPDDLARIIRNKGRGCKLFIRDLKKAYRQLYLDPFSIAVVGYVFEEKMYFDICLSMGSKSSAYCCQRTTNCITYIFESEGYCNVNYLDDLGGADTEDRAESAFICLGRILEEIGIWESSSKCIPPTQIGTFLGILYNTLKMTMELTTERLQELHHLLGKWLRLQSATLKEIQQILGKLAFACHTVRSGRVFVSKIINMTRNFPRNGRRRLTKEFKRDLNWWNTYMKEFDGISMIPDFKWTRPDEILATDSCLTGCGGWCDGEFFHHTFPKWLLDKNISINELETVAIIIALKIWGRRLKNKHALLFCDNQVSCETINAGKARNEFAQDCLREICYLTARENSVIKLVFKPGTDNRIPDFLSRWHLGKKYRDNFKKETGDSAKCEIRVHEHMFSFTHDW